MKNQIAKLRKRKGMKQKELAAALGIKTTRLGTWERGEREFSFEDACNIADILGCTLDELAGRPPVIAETSDAAKLVAGFQRLDFDGRASIMEQLSFQLGKLPKSLQDNSISGVA